MNIVACPSCSQQLKYNPQQAGQQVQCPSCHTAMMLPGALNPTPPADPLMGAPMQTPPTQTGTYGNQLAPTYSHGQTAPKKNSNPNSKKKIILWSSIGGGGLLVLVVVLILVFALGGRGGPPFPVPYYFNKATDLSNDEKILVDLDDSYNANWFYDIEGKSEKEIHAYFEDKLPSYGWENYGKGSFTKGEMKKLMQIIITPRQNTKKLRVWIYIVDPARAAERL